MIENERIAKILSLSLKISRFSPVLKPFVRFAGGDKNFSTQQRNYWDFDNLLQKKLLRILKNLATPAKLHKLYISHFTQNLQSLAENQEKALKTFVNQQAEYEYIFTPRMNLIISKLEPGAKFLYIGCGAGKECLHFAKKKLTVTGIDTSAPLVAAANNWAKTLRLPFKALEMDVLELNLADESYDGFLLEFYGSWASDGLKNQINRNLARILKPDGSGFIVAQRKKYASYWFKLSSHFSEGLTAWLKPQSMLDFFFDQADDFDERLHYGLYSQAHTESTLKAELNSHFEVVTCNYEDYDPRYVLAEVKTKVLSQGKSGESAQILELKQGQISEHESGFQKIRSFNPREIDKILKQIEEITEKLETHKNSLEELFKNNVAKNPLIAINFDSREFFELLNQLELEK